MSFYKNTLYNLFYIKKSPPKHKLNKSSVVSYETVLL